MKIICTAFCLLALHAAHAKDPSQEEKLAFVDYYREWSSLAEEFPDHQEVKVIFVDLDQDGTTEALATSKGFEYEDGSAWTAFRQSDAKWGQIQGYDPTADKPKRNATLFGRAGEFFVTRRGGDNFDFCVLSETYDKFAPQGKGPLKKTRFHLDSRGILRQENIPDLERYIAYQSSGANWPSNSLVQSLERLTFEIFPSGDVAENKEQNKAQHPTDGAAEPEKPKE